MGNAFCNPIPVTALSVVLFPRLPDAFPNSCPVNSFYAHDAFERSTEVR